MEGWWAGARRLAGPTLLPNHALAARPHFSNRPAFNSALGEHPLNVSKIIRVEDEREADSHVEDTIHLGGLDICQLLQPAEDGRAGPAFAIDHGLETPDERVRAGKSPTGRLMLVAARDRSAVVIRVTDDGKGIDRDRVLARAQEMGLVESTRTELTDDELMRIIGRPGFSTAAQVTDISGRGVGIDAVHTRVRALGGTVDMKSVKGEGPAMRTVKRDSRAKSSAWTSHVAQANSSRRPFGSSK